MSSWEPGFYKDYIGDMRIYHLSRPDLPTYGIEVFEVYPKTLTAQGVGNAEMDSYQTIEVEFMFHRWKYLGNDEIVGGKETLIGLGGLNVGTGVPLPESDTPVTARPTEIS